MKGKMVLGLDPAFRTGCKLAVLDENGNQQYEMRKLTKKEIDAKVKYALKLVDLEGFEKRAVSTLSGGQQQRVALARAIIKSPSYILLDEPLANIDPMMKLEIKQFIREVLSSRNITAIYVTHDESEAFFLGDMIVRINEGLVISVNVNERRNNND